MDEPVAICNVRPVALPLVIRRKWGVAAWESAPAAQAAFALEMDVAVTPVTRPEAWPTKFAGTLSLRGIEKVDAFGADAEPAAIVILMAPTGTVAADCANETPDVARIAKEQTELKRGDFIKINDCTVALCAIILQMAAGMAGKVFLQV